MEMNMKQAVNQATTQLEERSVLRAPASVFTENFGKFERIGATYTHRINQPRKGITVGHSKPVNQPEISDKQKLLKDIIRRLASSSKGYLGPGCSIMFYHNRSNFDRDSVKLFTLFADRWQPEPHILTWSWLVQWLNDFYTPTVITYVQDLSGNLPESPKPSAPLATGQPSTHQKNSLSMNLRFKNSEELTQYCRVLMKDGHAPGEVSNWMLKIMDKHGW